MTLICFLSAFWYKMNDLETGKIVCKLECIQAVIIPLLASDQLTKDDNSVIKDKLEQMEQLIFDLTEVNEKLTMYWLKKVTAFWKALVYEKFNVNESQCQKEKDKFTPPVFSSNVEEHSPETEETDKLKENSNNNQHDSVKSKYVNTSNRSVISKQSLEYISKYILPNRQESVENDHEAVTDQEENSVIMKMETDLSSLPTVQSPSHIGGIQQLHQFIEKMRLYDLSVMQSRHSVSLYLTALKKLSIDQKESYRELESTEFDYRSWCNLAAFLKQQMINFYTEQLQNGPTAGSPDANQLKCHYCKDFGHFLSHCPFRLSVLCTICFNYGHSQKHCIRYGFRK